MCHTSLIYHTPCHHTTISQLPCSHPTSGLSFSLALPMININRKLTIASPCPRTIINSTTSSWCYSCNSTWDMLKASKSERMERIQEFRAQTGYEGVLTPVRRLYDGGEEGGEVGGGSGNVVFGCEGGGEKCVFAGGEGFLGEEGKGGGGAEKGKGPVLSEDRVLAAQSSFAGAASPTNSLESNRSAKSLTMDDQGELWPRIWSLDLGGGELLVERDDFGNAVTVPDDVHTWRGSELERVIELGAMYRDRGMRRALEEQAIRPVAPMVAATVAKGVLEMSRCGPGL